jgi:hypothetical protein
VYRNFSPEKIEEIRKAWEKRHQYCEKRTLLV